MREIEIKGDSETIFLAPYVNSEVENEIKCVGTSHMPADRDMNCKENSSIRVSAILRLRIWLFFICYSDFM